VIFKTKEVNLIRLKNNAKINGRAREKKHDTAEDKAETFRVTKNKVTKAI